MDMLISAVVSDLVSRFISFLSQRYGKQFATTEAEDLERLRCVLLRIHTVVQEAEARQITNQGMVFQLKELMVGMYLGYYVLDTFKFQSLEEEGAPEDHQVSHKRLRLCSSTSTSTRKNTSLLAFGTECTTMLKSTLGRLETKISDVKEFVMLLPSCPRLPRQPYSTYLFMDKCMFGRHAEKEQVISFLLHDDQDLAILPIIGPHRIGKKTLVHHACQDERVRSRFPYAIFFHGDDLILRSRSLDPSRKYLCIVEFSWHVDVQAWETFRSSLDKAAASGSKVVIIARTDAIAKWATTSPIKLKSLSQEEYWYYFKALAFGTMDPDEHPRLASLGMQLATLLQGSFLSANILGELLRANPNPQFWRSILLSIRELVRTHLFSFGVHPEDLLERNSPINFAKVALVGGQSQGYLVYDLREASPAHSELPQLTSQELLTGGDIPVVDKFDVLVWRSRIPPFCDYVVTYEKQKPHRIMSKKHDMALRKHQHKYF